VFDTPFRPARKFTSKAIHGCSVVFERKEVADELKAFP
jgi:hypothetical protein